MGADVNVRISQNKLKQFLSNFDETRIFPKQTNTPNKTTIVKIHFPFLIGKSRTY